MPSKHYEILDEGEIKYIDHYKMREKKPIYYVRRYQEEYISSLDLKEDDRLKSITDICTEGIDLEKYCMDYFGVKKFNHCWMLNISPNWPKITRGNETFEKDQIQHLKEVISLFAEDAQRFTKLKYVIECGKNGDFIHAHCVFELNPHKPNNIAHMKKGNFLKSFRTIWDRHDSGWAQGLVGSKHALQTTYLTTKEMLSDKLDYLIEDLKPEGHKNKEHPELPILISDWD